MVGLVVVPVKTRADWAQALELRRQVFVEEQGISEEIEVGKADLAAIHVLATRDGAPVGTGRLVVEADGPLPDPPDAEAIAQQHMQRAEVAARLPRLQSPDGALRGHIGRMAIAAHARRQGVGRLVLAALEGTAWRLGLERVVLGAQLEAQPFYEATGYAPVGEPFVEAGIPHRWMEKRKRPAA